MLGCAGFWSSLFQRKFGNVWSEVEFKFLLETNFKKIKIHKKQQILIVRKRLLSDQLQLFIIKQNNS